MTVSEKLIKEGIKKERIRVTQNLIKKNMGLEDIVEITGLTEKEIEIIRLQMNN